MAMAFAAVLCEPRGDVDPAVAVALPLEPGHLSFLRVPQAFRSFQKLRIFFGKPSQEQAVNFFVVAGGAILTAFAREAIETCGGD